MTKRYLIEFVLVVSQKFTAEVDVPDHIADDDLRQYVQDQVDDPKIDFHDTQLIDQNTLASYLTAHEEIKE
jgi:hypothetical protein